MKIAFNVAYWTVGGVFGAVWPLACFGAIFMLDAPFRGFADEVTRYGVIAAIGFFPVLYFAAWRLGRAAVNQNRSALCIFAPLLVPLVSPTYVILYFTLIGPLTYGNA